MKTDCRLFTLALGYALSLALSLALFKVSEHQSVPSTPPAATELLPW